eukprot:TRINITY_DN57629_c0_g1_i1.p2 TRINITY_DN57629_c0_g1~~TRINITY_DN57629_c0_g1_i1.p2  ORF type:complete len:160 (+),score=47.13 TRINITY_DN57629_c0_g1_i1:80-559(+)
MGAAQTACCSCSHQRDDPVLSNALATDEGAVFYKEETAAPNAPPVAEVEKPATPRQAAEVKVASANDDVVTINLTRPPGSELGLDVDLQDEKTLLIDGIGKGLVSEYNEKALAQDANAYIVKTGDRIIEVNGVSGDSELLANRCTQDVELRVTIRRGRA